MAGPVRLLIESYGAQRLRIGGQSYASPILLAGDSVHPWALNAAEAITIESLAIVVAAAPEVLLIGCGAQAVPLPRAVREALRAAGIISDVMNTGAACRTYNVLAGEDRRVAAALIPV
jgi:uncharacterized protein